MILLYHPGAIPIHVPSQVPSPLLVDGEGWLQMRETQQGRTGAARYEAQHLNLALQKVLPQAQYCLGFCFGTYYDLL